MLGAREGLDSREARSSLEPST
ncbi:protein of unknown function [Candidatus Promineifilum breve]|uniref:Uncharacterized protein n=1 Tax=Candidatus Promineifilum breve TaxID=1806508 RepID=A0A161JZI1_9CHLR|nr:protein of unknown function [Candidatus Promineifilum breve]